MLHKVVEDVTIGAIAGSGPAYIFYLAEAMQQAAEEIGLSANQAKSLTKQTLKGSSILLSSVEESFSDLRGQVTSPNGTTEAATKAFDKAKVKEGIVNGIKQAFIRAKELSN